MGSRTCPQCGGPKDFYAEMCRECRYGPSDQRTYECVRCGEEFRSYNKNPTYCSRECKDLSQTAGLSVERVRDLYWGRGMTQNEIADELATTQKAVWGCMVRNQIPRRPPAKRNQWGKNNDNWKGEDASYQALHLRVERLRGKPKRCFECGTEDPDKNYDWANLSGEYGDPTDYTRLCRSCHWRMDGLVENLRGGDA